jgi:hypothetical protein
VSGGQADFTGAASNLKIREPIQAVFPLYRVKARYGGHQDKRIAGFINAEVPGRPSAPKKEKGHESEKD